MILEKVFMQAKPALAGVKVESVNIGLSLLAVALSNQSIGVTYVLKGEVDEVCGSIPSGNLRGMKAEEMARWAFEGKNVLTRAMGLAVLNALAEAPTETGVEKWTHLDTVDAVNLKKEDIIGVVGEIGPVMLRAKDLVKEMRVFERGESNRPEIYSESKEKELLPTCDVVFITSATLINQTLEGLLPYCKNAREVVMVGSSTPLYPAAFQETPISLLSGTKWIPERKEEIFQMVSQCAGMKQLIRHGEKFSVHV